MKKWIIWLKKTVHLDFSADQPCSNFYLLEMVPHIRSRP